VLDSRALARANPRRASAAVQQFERLGLRSGPTGRVLGQSFRVRAAGSITAWHFSRELAAQDRWPARAKLGRSPGRDPRAP
jgi:hypothetical protein